MSEADTNSTVQRSILVLDTGALINCVNLHSYQSELWSVEEVLREVRDKKAREMLLSLPVPIQTREPTPEAVRRGNDNNIITFFCLINCLIG